MISVIEIAAARHSIERMRNIFGDHDEAKEPATAAGSEGAEAQCLQGTARIKACVAAPEGKANQDGGTPCHAA